METKTIRGFEQWDRLGGFGWDESAGGSCECVSNPSAVNGEHFICDGNWKLIIDLFVTLDGWKVLGYFSKIWTFGVRKIF